MSKINWVDKHIEISTLPKKFKKITGTRFGAVLNANKWSTPFQAWCEITKTCEKPFEDNKFTNAGKVIEPKQAKYFADNYYQKVISPTDVYGEDYFKTTYGDFFPNEKVFGGMWDYLYSDDGEDYVIECKTTSRAEDWKGEIPIYYALQAALYAHLKGTENVVMICSFLEPKDYDKPEEFVPSIENTIVVPFKVHDYFPDFDNMILKAFDFWNNYVVKGISPDYDEKLDSEYLEILRKSNINPTTEIESLIQEYEKLEEDISAIQPLVKRQEEIKKLIKEYMEQHIEVGQNKSEIKTNKFVYTLALSSTTTIDKAKLEKDGLLGLYQKTSTSTRLTTKAIKEE